MNLTLTQTSLTKNFTAETADRNIIVDATYANDHLTRVSAAISDKSGAWCGNAQWDGNTYSINVNDPAVISEFVGIVEQLRTETV